MFVPIIPCKIEIPRDMHKMTAFCHVYKTFCYIYKNMSCKGTIETD